MHPLATATKRLRRHFFQLDLRSKITAALLAATLVMGSVVTLAVYFAARYQMTSQTQALLEARAQLEQREIELQLTGLLAVAESLASSSVTANALADTQGREIYLTPLLRNQKLAVSGASLSVADYRGRPLVSSVEPAPDCACEASFEKMMQTGRPQARLLMETESEAEAEAESESESRAGVGAGAVAAAHQRLDHRWVDPARSRAWWRERPPAAEARR